MSSIAFRRRSGTIGAAAVLALAVGLAGCTATGSEPAASSAPAVTSTATPGGGDVVALAAAFAATLSDDQRTALQQEYTFTNAQNWSNLPNGLLTGGGGGGGGGDRTGAPDGAMPSDGAMTGMPSDGAMPGAGGGSSTGRVGLQTGELSDEQWGALYDLLAAATGSAADEGFDEVLQHLAADDYLQAEGGGTDYGRGQYFIAFLGEPTDSGTWELQFGGHHLAVANTYTDGALAGATPSFRGIEPFTTVTVDGTEVDAEQQEAAAFADLLASLDDEQSATAELSESFNDILLGPGEDWAFPETAEGVRGSELTDDQRALVLAAMETYVGDVADADAEQILARYEDELDDTFVAFSGTGAMDTIGDYVRIDGPSVWIEFHQQSGIVLEGAHPHAVWRDETTDYGGLRS